MLLLSVPYQSAIAALVGTESMLDMSRSQAARETLKQFMAREDVRSAIIAQGIAPDEADARLDSLTDAEVIKLADQINQLPAGGDALGLAIALLVIVILVLVIMRLM
jgi:hypothetical protein